MYHFEPYHLWFRVDRRTDVTNLHGRVSGRFFMDESDATPAARAVFERLLSAPRGAARRLVIEKTPHNVCRIAYLEALAGAEPGEAGPRYVHIVRSGLDVARSIERIATVENPRADGHDLHNRWWGRWYSKWTALARDGAEHGYFTDEVGLLSSHAQKGAYEWLVSLGEADRWRPRLGERMLEVTYPDLAARTEDTLRAICRFYGIGSPRPWLDRAVSIMEPERKNTGGTLCLPPRMAAAFNAYMDRYGFVGHAEELHLARAPGRAAWRAQADTTHRVGSVTERGAGGHPAAILPERRAGRLTVLHVAPLFRLGMGGPVRSLIELAESMAARGHRVDVASREDADRPEGWGRGGDGAPRMVPYQTGSLPGCMFTPRELSTMSRLIERYDVVHFHGVWRPAILQLAPAAEQAGTEYVVSARGMLDGWAMSGERLKQRLYLSMGGASVLERAGCVHFTSERARSRGERWVGSGRSRVIPSFMDLRRFEDPPGPEPARRALGIPDDGVPLVVFPGRIDPSNGPDVLIRAASELARRGTGFRLVIAGDGEAGYVGRMTRMVSDLGLGERVHFAGLVTGALKHSLLSAATVMALPTHREGLGFAFFEALACGTPVLTARGVDAAPELEGGGGTVLSGLDPAEFASSLKEILADPHRSGVLGDRGRRWVFDYLRPASLVDRYESLYRTGGERRFFGPNVSPALAR